MKSSLQGLLLAIVLMGGAFSASAYEPTERQKAKANLSKAIYKDISRVVKDARKAPTFNFKYNTGFFDVSNAWYDPTNNTINLGEPIYDLCASFGKDSINVLAYVIGHELAHFYKDHGWGWSFGAANTGTDIGEVAYEKEYDSDAKALMEGEADYFAGIFCYMAGYDALGVSQDFIETLYTQLELPDETHGYPSKDDRKAIMANTQTRLETLIPVFDAANYLTIVGKYELAASCYDHIAADFPSREVYNNSGVALALEAISLYEPGELDFVYPFGLDANTRLDHAGTKGVGGTVAERRNMLLENAREMFDQAKSVDRDYAAAYINLSLVLDLMGEPEMATAMAGKGMKLSKESGNNILMANALIARGIALAHDDEEDEAREFFEMAREYDTEIAGLNLEIMAGEAKAYGQKRAPAAEKPSAAEEAINDLDPSLLEVALTSPNLVEIKAQNEQRSRLKVYSNVTNEYTAIMVRTYSYPRAEHGFVITPANFTGATARGIKVGDGMKKVREKYGSPAELRHGMQSRYYVYKETPIVFFVDAEDAVTGWMLYK